jgi:hypothetical protein
VNHIINLTSLKASAEQAKTSPAEPEIWQMEISPDEVLRLVEVARLAKEARQIEATHMPASAALYWAKVRLDEALKGIES